VVEHFIGYDRHGSKSRAGMRHPEPQDLAWFLHLRSVATSPGALWKAKRVPAIAAGAHGTAL